MARNKQTSSGIIEQVHGLAELSKRVAAEAGELEEKLREWDTAHGSSGAQLPKLSEMEPMWMPPVLKGRKGERQPVQPRHPLDPDDLMRMERMLRDKPYSHQELIQATGWEPNKIKALITNFSRDPETPLVNLGAANRALWFIPSKKALDEIKKG